MLDATGGDTGIQRKQILIAPVPCTYISFNIFTKCVYCAHTYIGDTVVFVQMISFERCIAEVKGMYNV